MAQALDELFPLVYNELRAIAHRRRQQWSGDYTVNTTALVHEAYLKLIDQTAIEVESKAHLLGVASTAMRHILIDYARQRRAAKRGGDIPKVSIEDMKLFLQEDVSLSDEGIDILIDLDEAMKRLEKINPMASRVVECRFFGGLSVKETAAALEVSEATVKRRTALAEMWLSRELSTQGNNSPPAG